jgi:hypothetical protein
MLIQRVKWRYTIANTIVTNCWRFAEQPQYIIYNIIYNGNMIVYYIIYICWLLVVFWRLSFTSPLMRQMEIPQYPCRKAHPDPIQQLPRAKLQTFRKWLMHTHWQSLRLIWWSEGPRRWPWSSPKWRPVTDVFCSLDSTSLRCQSASLAISWGSRPKQILIFVAKKKIITIYPRSTQWWSKSRQFTAGQNNFNMSLMFSWLRHYRVC